MNVSDDSLLPHTGQNLSPMSIRLAVQSLSLLVTLTGLVFISHFSSNHSYLVRVFRKKKYIKKKKKELFLSCCVLVLERMSCSILRHLNSESKLGLLSSWFIPSCKTVLSPDQLIFQNQKGFPSEVSAGTLQVREPFREVLNVASLWERSLKRYWIQQ